jgi:hypothetical protein
VPAFVPATPAPRKPELAGWECRMQKSGLSGHSSFFILPSAFAPRWLCWRFVGALWEPWGRMGVALGWLPPGYQHALGGFDVALSWLCAALPHHPALSLDAGVEQRRREG